MEDNDIDEEETFPADEIDRELVQICEEELKEGNWDEEKVPVYINKICERGMQALVGLGRPYKYVITVVMQQKVGSTIHSSMSCHWSNPADGCHTLIFPQQQRSKEQ